MRSMGRRHCIRVRRVIGYGRRRLLQKCARSHVNEHASVHECCICVALRIWRRQTHARCTATNEPANSSSTYSGKDEGIKS